jgi:hypothetical protein
LHLIYLSILISLNIRKNQEYQVQKRYSPAPDLPDYPEYQRKSEQSGAKELSEEILDSEFWIL